DVVALAHHAPSFHTTAGEIGCPAAWPVVAAASGVDLGRATEFSEVAHKGLIEHAALDEVLDERAVALIVHGCHDLPHPGNRGKRFRSVNVPRDLVEDSN